MKLTRDHIDHMADLAKLQITDEEARLYQKQLGEILDYIEKIEKLKLSADAPQMAHADDGVNVLREDTVAASSQATVDAICNSFPAKEGKLLSSPNVFGNSE